MIAEVDGLIVDEQGGFHRLRGCRNQILSLIFLPLLSEARIRCMIFWYKLMCIVQCMKEVTEEDST